MILGAGTRGLFGNRVENFVFMAAGGPEATATPAEIVLPPMPGY